MLQEAKELQDKAIKKLLKQKGSKITFKAPTGSGKTYMMAKFMNEVLSKNNDIVFLVTTLSKGGLGKQNYEKFTEYKAHEFKKLDPYYIATETAGEEKLHIPTEANVYILETAKSTKAGKLMRGPLVEFFRNMTEEGIFGGKGKKIYLIKDECHIQTTNIDEFGKYYSKIYNFSATPKLSRGQKPDVEITNAEAEKVKLIKHVEYDVQASFEEAVGKFEAIKADYRNLLGVNPCLIVQISNKNKADEELEQIFRILSSPEHTDLKWALIVGDKAKCDTNDLMKAKKLPVEQWRRYAKDPLSLLDIIIFKLTISEGWDIPRACMLYQVRDTQSEQLDEQVLGRVRRNPRLLDFENLSKEAQELAMTAWAYGEQPKDSANYVKVELKKFAKRKVQFKTTRLKDFASAQNCDISKYKTKSNGAIANKSIFELYDELKNSPNDIRSLINSEIKTANEWLNCISNLKAINKEYNDYNCDYSTVMETTKDEKGNEILVSFPDSSFFLENTYQKEIREWIWQREDNNDSFSFDSEAERDWAKKLQSLVQNVDTKRAVREEYGTFLFGKNFLDNSEIKFEYFLNGDKHFSYPDFIMKDSKNRIHIFEVKSVNNSSSFDIDKEEYDKKVNELKRCYKQASVITDNIFYLPIKDEDEWKITRYLNGNEDNITFEQFVSFIKR